MIYTSVYMNVREYHSRHFQSCLLAKVKLDSYVCWLNCALHLCRHGPFGVLTLLVGWQEEHLACKKYGVLECSIASKEAFMPKNSLIHPAISIEL